MRSLITVVLGHALIIASFYFQHTPFQKASPKKIKVNTFVQRVTAPSKTLQTQAPQTPQLEKVQQTQPQPAKSSVVKKISKSDQKKTTTQQSTPKKNPPQKQTQPDHQALITMMQKSLNSLNTSPGKLAFSQGTEKPIANLASESLIFGANYEEEIVAYLESLLSLPEKGSVKIRLTLKRDGNVQNIDIVNATSERNKSYIQTVLAGCTFSPFGKQFKGEPSHTFTITLVGR